MAKAKKSEATLTLEEKLEQALVAEEEQPYKVPDNWCWTYLGNLVSTSKERTMDFSVSSIRYVGLEHIEKDSGIIGYSYVTDVKSLKSVFHAGQILYGRLRPYLNKHDVATFDGVCSTDILVFQSSKAILPKYINFFLSQRDFIEYAISNSKGINLPRVSEMAVSKAFCPLPPLAEQQWIVERIERLYAKLDEVKENVQNVIDSFENRKSAILHKAFNGELTAKWRKETMANSDWRKKKLNDVCENIKAGGDKPEDFVECKDEEHQIPVVANGINNDGIIGYTNIGTAKSHTVTVSGRGTIGYSLYRSYTFLPVVRLIVITPREEISAKYIKYVFDAFPEKGTGSSIPQLTVPMIKDKEIPVPSYDEQIEIVRILDNILLKEQQAKEKAEEVLEKIELIKKSILARAFRGELGTNDPDEESSIELLKTVLSEDKDAKINSKSKSK